MKDTQVQLEAQFSFFSLHKSRLHCLCQLVLGVIQLRTVNLSSLSVSFGGEAHWLSSFRRIQRFLAEVCFPFDLLSQFVWHHFSGDPDSSEPTVLSMDRTNWKFGKTNINILMLSICRNGYALPLMWTVLKNKRGNSSQAERIELMSRFISVIQTDQIIRLVADREFIGQEWLNWLDAHYIHYIIRIRANQWVEHSNQKSQRASRVFRSEQWKVLRKPRWIKGVKVYLGGQKLQTNDYLILISNLPLRSARYYYAKRWGIEVLFGDLKKRGFNFEDTHLTHPQRISRLTAVLALAYVWAILVGEWTVRKKKSIPIKRYGRKARSIFCIGLKKLRKKILNNSDLQLVLHLLSCT